MITVPLEWWAGTLDHTQERVTVCRPFIRIGIIIIFNSWRVIRLLLLIS